MNPHKATYSTSEAATILKVDRRTILNWIRDGKLEAEPQQNGSRTFYRPTHASVDRILKEKARATTSK